MSMNSSTTITPMMPARMLASTDCSPSVAPTWRVLSIRKGTGKLPNLSCVASRCASSNVKLPEMTPLSSMAALIWGLETTSLSRTIVRKRPWLAAVCSPKTLPPSSVSVKVTKYCPNWSVSTPASRRPAPVRMVVKVGGSKVAPPLVASVSQRDGCPSFRLVRMHSPAGSDWSPVSTNSSSAVSWMSDSASWGSSMPGNSIRMRRAPSTCTNGSVTPIAFTRRSMICRAVSIASAVTSTSSGTSASNSTCKPPCKSSPRRIGRAGLVTTHTATATINTITIDQMMSLRRLIAFFLPQDALSGQTGRL